MKLIFSEYKIAEPNVVQLQVQRRSLPDLQDERQQKSSWQNFELKAQYINPQWELIDGLSDL